MPPTPTFSKGHKQAFVYLENERAVKNYIATLRKTAATKTPF